MLNVSEENLLKLWHFEKKLLTLLHVDSIGSPTWFLDACGPTNKPRHRLLLTNFNMGFELKSHAVQLGLDFSKATPELFEGKEMGEDALRVLAQYLKLFTRIQADMSAEIPLLQKATRWGGRLQPVGAELEVPHDLSAAEPNKARSLTPYKLNRIMAAGRAIEARRRTEQAEREMEELRQGLPPPK